jgi:hypothetical protein
MNGDDCHNPLSASFSGPWSADTLSVALFFATSQVPGPRHLAGHRDVLYRFPSPVPTTRRAVALPSSRVTPVNACPALRPRWCPACIAIAHPGLLPSAAGKASAFPTDQPVAILLTTTIHMSGLDHAACFLTTPGSIPPMTGTHAGSLLTGWLGVGQVGLELSLSPTGSQPRISRPLANPLASGFPWREQAVVLQILPSDNRRHRRREPVAQLGATATVYRTRREWCRPSGRLNACSIAKTSALNRSSVSGGIRSSEAPGPPDRIIAHHSSSSA